MLKKCTKTLVPLVLAGAMAMTAVNAPAYGGNKAYAVGTDSSFTYPFATGDNAFGNAPTFTTVSSEDAAAYKQDNANGHWEFIQAKFEQTDLSKANYFAVQIRVDEGNPGITTGLIENNDRFDNCVDGNKFYFMNEAGTISELSVLYSSINLGANACGTLIMPMAAMAWQWNNSSSDLTKVNSWFFTTNTNYNSGWALTVGEMGYYVGEPGANGTTFTKLIDLSAGEKEKSAYYVDSLNTSCMTMPSDSTAPKPETPQLVYPFRTGEHALDNSATWAGTKNGDTVDNYQTLKVDFDDATADFSKASYLVIQYYGKAGNPGITYGLQAGTARYSTVSDGKQIFFENEGANASNLLGTVLYGSINAGAQSKGALIIPMDSMVWQFGEETDKDLTKVNSLILTTNSLYNWAFEIVVGEVGYCIGEPGTAGSLYNRVLDLSADKTDKFTATSDLETNRCTVSINKAARETIGDVTVDVKGEGKTADSFGIWDGGSYGNVEMTTDSYNDVAMKLTSTGSNPAGDSYTAITMSGAGGFTWGGMKGASLWARNDSDTEISFNLEVDCKAPVTVKGETQLITDRFNVKQGNRYYLYDVNTGKTTIYMTRPTVTLPVGFEGWVWVPFTAFNRADWSNNGVTKNEFMSEGSTVTYLAITILSSAYENKSFSVNKFGAYSTTPSFRSSFVTGGSSIAELLNI